MKKFLLGSAIFLFSIFNAQKNDINYYIKNAPFKFGEVVLPTIPEKAYSIKDFGGIGNGKFLNTKAFETAISAINQNGGGKLIIPAGVWLTGPIELKSNINFHVEEGAIVQFSDDINQFPLRETSPGKIDVTPPIWGDNLHDVAFTGKGVFDGAGDAWRPVKKYKVDDFAWKNLLAKKGSVLSDDGKVWWPSLDAKEGERLSKSITKKKDATIEDYKKLHHFLRPMMFTLSKVKNLLIDGPTFRNSPKFILNPRQITNLVIKNTNVYNPSWAQNGDGIDISASKNVIIYNTYVNAGDDGICMKSSGESKDGEAKLQNVIIAECTVNDAHGGFVIGSNTDGGMKNIYVTNCTFDGSDNGIRVKSNSGRGGEVSEIYIDNITLKNIKENAFIFDTSYADAPVGSTKESEDAQKTGDKIPFFHHFYISNINCSETENAFMFLGLKEKPIQDLFFKNINIVKSNTDLKGDFFQNIVFENVNVNGQKDIKTPGKLKTAIQIK